jgi:glycosyltransferase involved in cell wall biosynthesis
MANMSRISVLYCIDAMVHGGTEKQLAALIKGLDRARFDPALCVLKPSTMDLSDLNCPVLELGFRSFRSVSAIGCVRRLRRFIQDRRVDVVQTFFQDATLVGCAASLRTSVRARVATFRDMGFWRTPAKVAQLRLAYPAFHGFIANCSAVAKQFHDLDGIPADKLAVIPNGVASIAPAVPRLAPARPVVGIVANMDRQVKRVDLFLDAAAIVARADRGAQFVIIGEGHLRPALIDQAARLGLADCVRFVGGVTNVTDHVRRFDIGVVCSDSEGLSNAILEYMSAGVPTVARNVGGNAELVADGETGRLVHSDRADALANAIVALLRDSRQRQRMAAKARQVAERTFSMPAYVSRHERYYERLLAAADCVPAAVMVNAR